MWAYSLLLISLLTIVSDTTEHTVNCTHFKTHFQVTGFLRKAKCIPHPKLPLGRWSRPVFLNCHHPHGEDALTILLGRESPMKDMEKRWQYSMRLLCLPLVMAEGFCLWSAVWNIRLVTAVHFAQCPAWHWNPCQLLDQIAFYYTPNFYAPLPLPIQHSSDHNWLNYFNKHSR